MRTSRIRRELGSSEKELSALEREMREIGACCVPVCVAACGGTCVQVPLRF